SGSNCSGCSGCRPSREGGHPRRRTGEMARGRRVVRACDALAVDNVHPAPIRAEGDVVRLVGGWNQACDLVGLAARGRNYRHGGCAGIDGVEGLAITRQRHCEGRGASVVQGVAVAVAVAIALTIAVAITLTVAVAITLTIAVAITLTIVIVIAFVTGTGQ